MKTNKLFPIFLFVLSPMVITSCSKKGASGSISGEVVDENAIYTATLNPCNGDEQYQKDHVLKGKHGTFANLPRQGNGITPTKDGYNFAGWSTQYDKNSGMGAKDHRLSDNVVAFDSQNIVLYAIYNKTGIDSATAEAELAKWKEMSQPNHLYYHYFRFDKTQECYDDWDVWAWPYAPTAGEGTKFDWVGRTQNPEHKEQQASGHATIDQYAGAYIDIDLKGAYTGGWDNDNKVITNVPVNFSDCTKIGLQIVQTSTRTGTGKFWTNDGSNLYINLADYAVDCNGGKAYHIFVVQDNVQSPSPLPTGEKDPFEGDTGTNTTYGNGKYDNINWSKRTDMVKTSKDFSELGVGYQIMVSSFADSDGDGFGDIYGITQKLDYLQNLGVKAVWLTPIQLSDSYHGYDITDYEKVDPKFGSATSPAGQANGGNVDSDTALADYKELIAEAHKRGMKIVMDLVLNHTSTSNAWFVKSANLDEHFRGYYQWGNHTNPDTPEINQNNNWYPYGSHPYSYYAKFGSSMPELNFSYMMTRKAVEEMSIYWARDIGVDGFRLDAIKHIFMTNEVSSTSGDTVIKDISDSGDYSSDLSKNLQFFRELKTIVTTCAHKDVFFVGENFDGHAYQVSPYYESFDSLFDFYTYFNLTSGAATGRTGSTSAFGTVQGFLGNTSTFNASSEASIIDSANVFQKANGKQWNFPAVYGVYNAYRQDTSLPGVFTSNHDIARVVNRIAGTGTPEGLQAQGNLTTSNYAGFEKSANCVKIAELMFPGLTWIYYGDEIGMTGNIDGDPTKASEIPYADLSYRQPMKWVANGSKGDGSGTTDYYVTGSSMKVEQDEVNKSSVVKPALEQMNDANSDYSLMKKFATLKSGDNEVGKALRVGSMSAINCTSGNLAANVLSFERKSGSTTVKVIVNLNINQAFSPNDNNNRYYGITGTVLASYNGASTTSLPPLSAVVVKA